MPSIQAFCNAVKRGDLETVFINTVKCLIFHYFLFLKHESLGTTE